MFLRIAIPLLWAASFVLLSANLLATRVTTRHGFHVILPLALAALDIAVVQGFVTPRLAARPWSSDRRAAATFGAYWALGLLLAAILSFATRKA